MEQVGWVGKQDLEAFIEQTKSGYCAFGYDKTFMTTLYKTKGVKSDWNAYDWPPVKVKLSLELV